MNTKYSHTEVQDGICMRSLKYTSLKLVTRESIIYPLNMFVNDEHFCISNKLDADTTFFLDNTILYEYHSIGVIIEQTSLIFKGTNNGSD